MVNSRTLTFAAEGRAAWQTPSPSPAVRGLRLYAEDKDGGSIILNSSIANVLGVPAFTAYAASKAAVRSFARLDDGTKGSQDSCEFDESWSNGNSGFGAAGLTAEQAAASSPPNSARPQRQARGNRIRGHGAGLTPAWSLLELSSNTTSEKHYELCIVGFGEIGHAFARKNIDVTVASHRPPEALAPQTRAIGPAVAAKLLRG